MNPAMIQMALPILKRMFSSGEFGKLMGAGDGSWMSGLTALVDETTPHDEIASAVSLLAGRMPDDDEAARKFADAVSNALLALRTLRVSTTP